ncbi:hypothetical protein DAEQUDRAFT_761324 [Daedalea quercina L-15889]|uniref:Translation initiation factor 3 N-terminal domain-containing protein n=1 Tax=Daedalea quercina L-15889 TaxID=1314783 RepID=A0A165U6S5_9APHY|nr:hypothetical protein DAEQUDRAFT_761324 [Daedalea quercina L-15889]
MPPIGAFARMSVCVLRAATRGSLRQMVVHPFRARPVASTSHFIHSSAPALAGGTRRKNNKKNLIVRNEDIPFRVVKLVDRETGRLGDEWLALADILKTVDRKREYLELVGEKPDPIVKVFKSSDIFNKKRLEAEKKKAKRVQKEVQVSWAISPGDLEHKLEKVREELEAGNRVDLAYVTKSGQAKPTKEQMGARAEESVKVLSDVGTEWKERTVTKTALVIHWQGQNEPTAEATMDHLKAHMAERAQQKKERREKQLMRQTRYQNKDSENPAPSAS